MAKADSKKVIWAALIGNLLIAITKIVAAVVTRSSAMASESIHSLVDTGNQILLLLGLARSRRAASAEHPFGHGKEVYFWSFVVAILIFAVGAGISIYGGVRQILHPHELHDPKIAYVVLGLSAVFEGFAWAFALREFTRSKGRWGLLQAVQRSKDPTTFVVLFEDSAALLGIFVAAAGIALAQVTGQAWIDGAASVAIGLILGGTAVWLAIETKGLLIGEAASPELVAGIGELAREVPEIDRVGEILTLHMGPEHILVVMGVDFHDRCSAGDVEQAVARLDAAIRHRYPRVKTVSIEAESLVPRRVGG